MSDKTPEVENSRVTWEGCSVLLDVNDGDRLVFARLTQGSTLKIGNKNYSLKPLIGCPFGSLFEVETGAQGSWLSRVLGSSVEGKCINENESSEQQEERRDNRALVDNNKAQTLTGEDIEALRREGATGEEIIGALIANSATFEKKTVFSQEKYKLKKQKKYAPRVLMRRPVSRSICEAYFKKYAPRIGFLRVDTLSLLLSMANVTANSDILVLDMVGGLVTGAVAERLGGSGYICNTFIGNKPYPIEIVRMFNFSDLVCKRILRSSLSELGPSQNDDASESEIITDPPPVTSNPVNSSNVQMESNDPLGAEENPTENEMLDVTAENTVKSSKASKAGEKAPEEVIKSWKENGFSSLVVAAPELDICSVIKDLLPLLAYSAPFAIYHQYLQPLATCMNYLQREKMAIGLQITEPWLREYQVLPSRTHPHMQMSAFGGYILSGTRICSTTLQNSTPKE